MCLQAVFLAMKIFNLENYFTLFKSSIFDRNNFKLFYE